MDTLDTGYLSFCLSASRVSDWQWFIDVHDQSTIVRQYMRYAAQISSPANLPHQVRRALQMYAPCSIMHVGLAHMIACSAMSEPKGPVYLWGRRETMEQEIDSSLLDMPISLTKWPSVQPTALPTSGMVSPVLMISSIDLVCL